MNIQPIVIRINTGNEAMDWTVQRPDQITFRDSLEAIHQVLGQFATVQAFEYEDEEGDRITVRDDNDMINMLHYYVECISGYNVGNVEPLVIYPRNFKSHGNRNVHGLKVHTKEEEANNLVHNDPAKPQAGETDQGSRKRSGDIREILAWGNIADSDLQFLEILGSGNCGTVHKAQHVQSSTVMAVKVIYLDVTLDAKKQIMAELEILYLCESPMIIAFYGAYFMENRISICTEFMDGGSLDRYGQTPEHILGRVAASVVKGLQYLWSLKILHRDVKPSNILVNTEGQVKLCDFGVSVQLIDSIAKTFIGTNAYMAPERINGQEYSIHSEVWSLGVSLFEMASGKFPYDSAQSAVAKPIDLLKSIVDKEPPQLPRNGHFSDGFVNFVAECMQKVPLARPAPEALMRHPFIQHYNDGNAHVVTQWVQTRLIEMAVSSS